jgi:hypothetical protein
MVSPSFFVISFIFVIHWDYDIGFLISLSRYFLISIRYLSCPASAVSLYFMYHVKVISLNVVSSCMIFVASFVILFIDHIASHVNQCCSTLSLPIALKTCNLRVLSWFTIFKWELDPPLWLLGVKFLNTNPLIGEVALTSTSSSLVYFLLSSLTLSSTPIASIYDSLSSWLQICKGVVQRGVCPSSYDIPCDVT